MTTEAADREADRPEPAADSELVARTLAGDLVAFGRLYDRYVRLVHVTCFDTTGDASAAEDLVHDTFVRAYRSVNRLRRPERFGSWLMGISYHVCKDWQRKRARERKHLEPLARWPRPDGAMDEIEPLRQALLRLSHEERTALHLFYLEQQPAEQAQKVLQLSRSGFYKLLDRAKNRLRKLLTEEEG